MRGTMPCACFDISTSVLALYAQYAAAGELIVLNVEDGVGDRLHAGGETDDLDDDEVDALRREYGWIADAS